MITTWSFTKLDFFLTENPRWPPFVDIPYSIVPKGNAHKNYRYFTHKQVEIFTETSVPSF
jgi:hypothetical protein